MAVHDVGNAFGVAIALKTGKSHKLKTLHTLFDYVCALIT